MAGITAFGLNITRTPPAGSFIPLGGLETLLAGAGIDLASVIAQATATCADYSKSADDLTKRSETKAEQARSDHYAAMKAAKDVLDDQLDAADDMAEQAKTAALEAERLTRVLAMVTPAVNKTPVAAETPVTK